jgi:hypothetical protein
VIVATPALRRTLRSAAFGLAVLGLVSACPAGAVTAPAPAAGELALAPPCRLASVSLDRVVPLLSGEGSPELLLAQRAIDRDFGAKPADPTHYAVVEVPGWKSEGGAAAMSLVLPGTGQLYSGSKSGYVFLGIEAAALLGYATFKSKSDEKRDEYYSYVGDPNDPNSRFSFDRLSGDVPPQEMARLRTVYERDRAEFYNTVTKKDAYAAGWGDLDERGDALLISDEAESQDNKSQISFYALMANHLVSAVDALRLARFTNNTLRENMTLKLKLRPGAHGSYAFTLTQKF